MVTRIIQAAVEAGFYMGLATVVCWIMLPSNVLADTLEQNGFARRWDGSCTGWTKPLVVLHSVGDYGTCYAYFLIAVILARLHPVMRFVRSAPLTVTLMCTVFVTCGLVHLGSAYTNFHPLYWQLGWLKMIAAAVGVIGAMFMAHDLLVAGARLSHERREIEQRKRQYAVQRNKLGE